MDIAINTDFLGGNRSPEAYLKAIAEAGFTHLHWCHHWNTDFFYNRSEVKQYSKWMQEFGLQLLDVHGSDGQEKRWYSSVEYERQAGVELVINRIVMLHELGGTGSLIMHIPLHREEAAFGAALTALTAFGVKQSLSQAAALIQYES